MTKCNVIEIPRFTDPRGSLSVIEGTPLLPFDPKRFYFIYEVAPGARRGGHAHKTEHKFIVALAGSFTVTVDDGNSINDFRLEKPDCGLYLPPLLWHEVHAFTPGVVCAVLGSERYDPDDYYNDYEDFVRASHERRL